MKSSALLLHNKQLEDSMVSKAPETITMLNGKEIRTETVSHAPTHFDICPDGCEENNRCSKCVRKNNLLLKLLPYYKSLNAKKITCTMIGDEIDTVVLSDMLVETNEPSGESNTAIMLNGKEIRTVTVPRAPNHGNGCDCTKKKKCDNCSRKKNKDTQLRTILLPYYEVSKAKEIIFTMIDDKIDTVELRDIPRDHS